ncbi:MAG TPA: ankyrin repeat domain-containing protein, partial [Longimicrobium sp.]|nr:ankyrin repeat domain-containing protein [Longimicrobium sp.]
MTIETDDPHAAFIRAAVAPLHAHASGTLDDAKAILAAHPEIATADVHAAAVLGDDATVRRFLAADPASATAKGGPYGWDALTHLCFSRYLRLDPARSDGFVRAAEALLDAGASASTGYHADDHQPGPAFESALYGAAGVAHNPDLTRLLLARGADPNDDETPYHAPEGYDNRALEVLVESGRLTPASLALVLLRKADWHDGDAIRWLLERGADPNLRWAGGWSALHHAVLRDNALASIAAMLDHGGDPTAGTHGVSTVALAARRGRGDLLELFERRGIST